MQMEWQEWMLPVKVHRGSNSQVYPVSYTHLDVYKRQVLERIENPLAAVTDERAAYLQQEKEFYTVLASKIRE